MEEFIQKSDDKLLEDAEENDKGDCVVHWKPRHASKKKTIKQRGILLSAKSEDTIMMYQFGGQPDEVASLTNTSEIEAIVEKFKGYCSGFRGREFSFC